MSGLLKSNLTALKGLATEEDLAQLMRIYDEYFDIEADGELRVIDEDAMSTYSSGDFDTQGGDLGMEVEWNLDPEMLAEALGFLRKSLPHQFTTIRHAAGANEWQNPQRFEGPENLSNLKPLTLHWHQLAGVHSIIRNIFTKKRKSKHCTGMLIADEVGLGKTALAISVIAFLNQSARVQDKGEELPPILRGCLGIV